MYNREFYSRIKDYVADKGQGLKGKGAAALVGLGLLSMIGCGGVRSVPESSVSDTNVYQTNELRDNPALKREVLGETTASPNAYAQFIKGVNESWGSGPTQLDKIFEHYDDAVGDKINIEDRIIEDPASLHFKDNFYIAKDLQLKTLEDVVGKAEKEDMIDASKRDDTVPGLMYKKQGSQYYLIPQGEGYLISILKEGLDQEFERKYGNVDVDEISTYDLKQGGRQLGTATVYQVEDYGGKVLPKINLFGNGYSVSGKPLSAEEIKEHLEKRATRESDRRGRDVEASDYRVSHETSSSGAMEARGISAALTGGAGVLLHPVVGAGVFAANLFKTAEFDDVIDYNNYMNYKYGRADLSDLLRNEQNRTTYTIISPVYDNDQLAGVVKYDLNKTDKNIVIASDGVHVEESNKLLKGVAGDVLRLGAAALLYEVGKSEGDETIRKKTDEPTGGVTRPGGSGPGVTPR